MRFRLLACDYDRTIAVDAVVSEPVRQALREVRSSGRRLVLVTGRTLAELNDVFDAPRLFDRILVENGAALYDPAAASEQLLAPPVPRALVDELRRRELRPLVVGSAIISTAEANDSEVLAALGDLGLDLKLTYNRDSVMILPPGVSKSTGLRAATAALGVPRPSVVAVGDGENDLALFDAAGLTVAVANAVEPLKERADIVLTVPGQEGIRELCESLARRDLQDLQSSAKADLLRRT